jgi:hypothetical protein
MTIFFNSGVIFSRLFCALHYALHVSFSVLKEFIRCLPLSDRIVVRQTKDPFHDTADVQYIACSRVIFPDNGDLDLSNLGVGNPGDLFVVRSLLHCSDYIPSSHFDCR